MTLSKERFGAVKTSKALLRGKHNSVKRVGFVFDVGCQRCFRRRQLRRLYSVQYWRYRVVLHAFCYVGPGEGEVGAIEEFVGGLRRLLNR